MPESGPVPQWVLNLFAVGTVFTVMFSVGLAVVVSDLRVVWQRPGLMLRGLFSVLVAVPALALLITRSLDLPRVAEVGIVLMSISPGAPVALRRSLGAGGHRAFAPSLQIAVALLATFTMPLSIAALNEVYAGHASISAWTWPQVFVAQVPSRAGHDGEALPRVARGRLEPKLARAGNVLLIVLCSSS
jgi:predicted Na+-dependent transporter